MALWLQLSMHLVRSMSLALVLWGTVLSAGHAKHPAASPQKLPPNPCHAPGVVPAAVTKNRPIFHAMVANHVHINKAIPPSDDDTLRVLHYNVNFFTDLSGFTNSLEKIRRDLEYLRPAVVVFFEVPREELSLRARFDHILHMAGFVHTHYHAPPRSMAGTLIVSRAALENTQAKKAHASYFYTSASFRVKAFRLYLVTASLPRAADQSASTIRGLTAFINDSMANNSIHDQFLLATNLDLGTLVGGQAPTVAPWIARNAFTTLGWAPPTFTTYACDVRDQLLISEAAEKQLTGAYLYLTSSSTHFPIVADFHVPGAADDLVGLKFATAALWFIAGSLLFILIVSGAGIYFWIRSKLYDY